MTFIYYFTRTGDSKKIAEEIAAQTGGKIREITDKKNWNGILGFIKCILYLAGQKKVQAIYEKPQDTDTIYLCFPVWASVVPPTVCSFLEEIGRERVIAVPKSMSGPLADKTGFAKVIEIIGKDLSINVNKDR